MPVILIKKTAEEPGAASLAVTVPVEQVQQAEDRATSAYQRRARLPGFRKGKAPAAIVKKHFADDIRQEALQELIRESWKVAVEQESLKPIADPHVHNLKWDVGDRKSTRLNSSHSQISYAVFCLKKKKNTANVRATPVTQVEHNTEPRLALRLRRQCSSTVFACLSRPIACWRERPRRVRRTSNAV